MEQLNDLDDLLLGAPSSKEKTRKRKRCGRCKDLKLVAEFPKCRTGKDGLYSYCHPCHALDQNARNPKRQEIDEKIARRTGLKKLGMKTCTSCQGVFLLNEFYSDPRHSDGKQSICKACWSEKSNRFYLQKEYGLTPEEFILLLDAQDGLCAICGRAPKHNKFNVDHCHKTHRIRALLCVNCNTNLLPYVERFPNWVQRAFTYLESPPGFAVLGERFVPETNQARLKQKKRHQGS